MDRLDEIGIAREGLPRGGLIPPEERRNIVLLYIQSGKLEPRERVFQVAPDPLERVQLGAVRRQEHQAHVGWEREPLGGMRATIVHHQEIEAVGKGRREGLDEELEAFGVQIGPFEKEPVACRRLHRAIDVEPFEDMWHAPDGLHTARGEAPTADGQQAKAAFVLTEDPDRAGVGGGNRLLELFMTGGLEYGDGLRLFLCGSGAALCVWRGSAYAPAHTGFYM
jgi:hypothetical protein